MNIEIGTYNNPDAVGFQGWVSTTKSITFIAQDGSMVVFDNPTN